MKIKTAAVTLEYPNTNGEFTIKDIETLNKNLNLKSYVVSFQVKKDFEAGKLVRLTKTRPTGGKGKPANLYTVATISEVSDPEVNQVKIEIPVTVSTESVAEVKVTNTIEKEKVVA